MANLLFILGRGRSGTTLLSKILNAHPDIAVAPEGFFAYSLKAKYQNVSWDDRTIEGFIKDLNLENRLKTWNLDFERLESCLKQLPDPTYTKVCKAVYEEYAERIGKPNPDWVVDKNPLDTAHQTKWTQKMRGIDTLLADAICQPSARQLGYQPSNKITPSFKIQLHVLKGTVSDYLRILAEELLFTFCPLNLRTFVTNQYRYSTGRT